MPSKMRIILLDGAATGRHTPQSSRPHHELWTIGGENCRVSSRRRPEIVFADDTVEAFEAFVGIFDRPPYGLRVCLLFDRGREIAAGIGLYDQHGSRLSFLPRPLIAGRYVCLWRLRRRDATVKRRCPKAELRKLNQLTARQVS